jgi:tetratricopeptide (TPR) repeat protein
MLPTAQRDKLREMSLLDPLKCLPRAFAAATQRFVRTTALLVVAIALVVGPIEAQQPSGDELDALGRQLSKLALDRNFGEALPLAERAQQLTEQRLPPGHPLIAGALIDLGYVLAQLGRHAEAEPRYTRALAILDAASTKDEANIWNVLNLLAAAIQAQGRDADATAYLTRARAIEVAAAKPFSIELEPQEIITTDLKRLTLRDCGRISFEVREPSLFVFLGEALVAEGSRHAVTAARRSVLGNKSLAEIRDQADAVRDEIKRLVDETMKDRGVAVTDMPGDLRTCAVPVRPPE